MEKCKIVADVEKEIKIRQKKLFDGRLQGKKGKSFN